MLRPVPFKCIANMQLSFIVDNLPSFLLILGAVYFLTVRVNYYIDID